MRISRSFYVRAPAFFLSVSLLFSLVFSVPAYAGVSTSSDAFYPFSGFDGPDAGGFDLDDLDGLDDGLIAADSGITVTKVQNTVSFDTMYMCLTYYNTRGGVSTSYCLLGSDGYFHFEKPSDLKSFRTLEPHFAARNLPVTGNYAFAFNYIMDTGVTYRKQLNDAAIFTRFHSTNATDVTKNSFIIGDGNLDIEYRVNDVNGYMDVKQGRNGSVVQYSSFGEFYGYVPSIGFINTTDITFIPNVVVTDVSFPCSGYLRAQFTRTGTQPVITTPGTAPSDTDIQQDIASGISGIASTVTQVVTGVSQVAQGIQELPAKIVAGMEPHYSNILQQLHHITEQLHAFWNQLAAYFDGKLIPQMISDTDRIVDAINDIDLQVEVSLTELVNTLNKNHKEQLEADKKNTDTITNGYDNKPLKDTNDKLSDSLSQYEQAESELLKDVQGHIDDFQYTDPFTRFTAPLADVSFFLTGIYNGLGVFNIPIAFSLTLTIALICIGWYRFKGG